MQRSQLEYLLQLIPDHQQYCEPFFNDGFFFFTKQGQPGVISLNDVRGNITNFFKVLRQYPQEFLDMYHGKTVYSDSTEQISSALSWFKQLQSIFKDNESHKDLRDKYNLHSWIWEIEYLPEIIDKFRRTQVFNRGCWASMAVCDTPQCLHYVELPPIEQAIPSSEVTDFVCKNRWVVDRNYDLHMTLADHDFLVENMINNIKGYIILVVSAPHKIYDKLDDAGWQHCDIGENLVYVHPRILQECNLDWNSKLGFKVSLGIKSS